MPFGSMETLASSPDEQGNCHRLSIDSLTSKLHNHVTTYEGKIFTFSKTHDPRNRILVVVKFPALKHNSEMWAQCELEKSKLVRKMARKFNEYVRHAIYTLSDAINLEGTIIKFLDCQMATVDSTTILDRKRKKKGDCLVFEDALERFSHFMNVSGEVKMRRRPRSGNHEHRRPHGLRTPSRPVPISVVRDRRSSTVESNEIRSCEDASPIERDTPPSYEESELERLFKVYGTTAPSERVILASEMICLISSMESLNASSPRTSPDVDEVSSENNVKLNEERDMPNPLLQAFVHFFFCHTNGQAVVCGLKGEKDENRYILVTPVMHSLGQHFGHRDGGEAAMRKVIENHRCSSLCRHLPDMSLLLNEAKRCPSHNCDFL